MRPATIFRPFAALLLGLGLTGCIFTETPVFGTASSRAPEASPELQEWLAVAARFAWSDDPDAPLVPVPFWQGDAPDAPKSVVRVAGIGAGGIVIQETLGGDCPSGQCAAYYSLRLRDGGVPEICWVNTREAAAMEAAAKAAGVRLATVATHEDKSHLPPDIAVSGPAAAVRGFILGRFAAPEIFCDAPPLGDEAPAP